MGERPILAGLRAIATAYDVFLVDLWGVVHDGERPFPGVVEGLKELRRAGARVLFLSNSSRLGPLLEDMLVKMGIARDTFDAAISSGDVTREALASRDRSIFGPLPERPRCLHVGDPGFVPWLFELDLDFVEAAADADLVLATGTLRTDDELARVRDRLAPAAARGAPLVCTNPDRIVPTYAGVKLGPGAIAHAYAALGAPTFLYGKPHAPIYAHALDRVGTRAPVAKERVVAIGDLLDTDVRGAREVGVASVLVTGTGVHAAALGDPPAAAALEALYAEAGVEPDMVLSRFAW